MARVAPPQPNEAMAIMLGNKTGLSIIKFFESPFADKHPELINTSTEAAAAESSLVYTSHLQRK